MALLLLQLIGQNRSQKHWLLLLFQQNHYTVLSKLHLAIIDLLDFLIGWMINYGSSTYKTLQELQNCPNGQRKALLL